MSPKSFILLRSLLAIALMVGFYGLALLMIAGLAWVGFAALTEGRLGFLTLKVVAFSGIGMVTIFFAILPRREEFEQPGPLLEPEEYPDLHKEIQAIALQAGQAGPEEVYLLPDMNAFVGERGGFLGFARTRILGVGLPLLQSLTLPELRAVLAHEFGHFHGGDTAIGPWIHKIRAAMARTLQGLQEQSVILRKPFEWYGILFLRTTLAVSRQQEYAADRLAASIAGLAPMVSGLKKIHALSHLTSVYWDQEIGPAVKKGFRPRVAEGFQAFLSSPLATDATPKILSSVLEQENTNPYDSHPCLRDRLKALGGDDSPLPALGAETGSALALVRGIEKAEPGLFGFLMKINPERLDPVAWEDTGEKVHRPHLEEYLKPFQEKLAGFRIPDYPVLINQPARVAEALREIGGVPEEEEGRKSFVAFLLEAHLMLRLCAMGWSLHSRPGRPLECRPRDGASNQGFAAGSIQKDLEGKAADDPAWAARCRAWQLA